MVVGMLPLIAGAVYLKGRDIDPNLFALDPAALAAPRAASAPTAGVLHLTADPEIPRSEGSGNKSTSFALPRHLAGLEWDADGPPEDFTPHTLFQKIDGRADEYLKDGFAGLETISYARGSQFIDVFVYDMGTDAHARDRFRTERPSTATAVPLARDAYCAASSCFLIADKYYAQVIGSEPGAAMERAARDAARTVADLIGRRLQ